MAAAVLGDVAAYFGVASMGYDGWRKGRLIAMPGKARFRRALQNEVFGKRILFTDRNNWPAAGVVAACRSQAEAGFRQLKDRHAVSFSPMFHWIEQKIRVHVFYCVLALTIAHLMCRQATTAGLDLSVRELRRTLSGIQETVMIYPSTGGRPRARRILTDRDPTQQHLFNLFELATYAPQT